jgi:hypothetical protein
MKTAPEGLSPAFFWAAAGECLLAVASAPGERSYVYGKPMPETGNCIFRAIPRCRCRGDDARIPAGASCRGGGALVRRGLAGRLHWEARAALIPRRPDAVEPRIQYVRTQ